jgi:amino acid transporter
MGQLRRAIDLRGAIAINVITMIGIGPLVTIPLVVAALGGPLALVGWIAGAIVALCDGMVWAELASRFPGSGGTYVYLRESFGAQRLGRALAFLFNWQFLLYAPCLLASGYIGFANYAAYLYPSLGSNRLAHDAAAIAIGLLTMLLLYRRTAKVASLGALLAVAAALTVLLVALAGLSHADLGRAFHLSGPFRFSTGFLAGFGSALLITLYDYAGYADAALLGDEVQRPQRTIPLAILLSVLLVAALYVLLQIGVLGAVPWRSLLDAHGTPTTQAQYVGAFVVERTWGRIAAWGVTLLVLVTAFASLYGNLLGFSRISFAAARDGAFLPAFARLHPRKDIPHVALLVVGALSLVASLFTLDQVIAILTAGIVLIQGIAQIVALAWLRVRREAAPFRMPLYPLPALIALVGWVLAFVSAGPFAIALGVGWLAAGAIIYLVAARAQRWWPFALAAIALLLPCALPSPVGADSTKGTAAGAALSWSRWQASRITSDHGYPAFSVDGRPFFVYGAAFFYERIARERWHDALVAYKRLGINTIDLYLIWNWHEPIEGVADFTGATDPRRDLVTLLKETHELGFKLILRPGPVIRNEWRNGGYPAWLLERPEYRMPLHDVLEGRYPATATLQNRHADAAAAEWLHNATHLGLAAQWLRDVLGVAAPYANDVIAIALDDDQGAYLDNDTWPAPHWHAYVDWLRRVVSSVTGNRVPLFLNTYEMKVPAAAPAWAWGNWYQGGSYRIGAHDLADLDFATGLLQTQIHVPVMQSEFQAGWFQNGDEGEPRPSDPSNTALALNELLRDGAHGIVNFPVQDTIYPHGWEAPWANWSYAWDAALTVDLAASPRYAPTYAFGDVVRAFGPLLARTHVAADASIIWPPALFRPGTLSNDDFAAFADATTGLQRSCNARGLTCTLVDPSSLRNGAAHTNFLLPALPSALAQRMEPRGAAMLEQLERSQRLFSSPSLIPHASGASLPPGVTLLRGDDNSYAFVVVVNASDSRRWVNGFRVTLLHRRVTVGAFSVPARGARVVPVGIAAAHFPGGPAPPSATPPPFRDPGGTTVANAHLRVVFAPFAGARIAELGDGTSNAATSIGLLRDATNPIPPASSRDYIASYTHPLPAGTFNRLYQCSRLDTGMNTTITCSYDAPDLPRGGALFERTLKLSANGRALIVDEHFSPHDARSNARLESVSGFAFGTGDTVLASNDGNARGILHHGRLAVLRWRPGDVARVQSRTTRGAELLMLIFARRSVELRLGVYPGRNAAEAQRLLDANQP